MTSFEDSFDYQDRSPAKIALENLDRTAEVLAMAGEAMEYNSDLFLEQLQQIVARLEIFGWDAEASSAFIVGGSTEYADVFVTGNHQQEGLHAIRTHDYKFDTHTLGWRVVLSEGASKVFWECALEHDPRYGTAISFQQSELSEEQASAEFTKQYLRFLTECPDDTLADTIPRQVAKVADDMSGASFSISTSKKNIAVEVISADEMRKRFRQPQ